nr:acetyl-CoA carboxylase carboxyltransferase beta subunit [Leea guineensis]
MEKLWFNSMFSNEKFEYRCGLNKPMDSPDPNPIENENTSGGEDRVLNNRDKNINNWSEIKSSSSSYSNVDYLFSDIRNFIFDAAFLVRDSNGRSYFIYFDIENHIFEIDNDHSFLSERKSFFSSYRNSSYLNNVNSRDLNNVNSRDLNNVSKSNHPLSARYMYDTKYSWNNHINSCIDNYILSGSNNYSDSYIYSYICGQTRTRSKRASSSKRIRRDLTRTRSKRESSSKRTRRDLTRTRSKRESSSKRTRRDLLTRTRRKSSPVRYGTRKYRHLWKQCENCYGLTYRKQLNPKINICEQCGYHLKMRSSDRIELSIDPGTWNPLDEDMFSGDPIKFHSAAEAYKDRIDFYQRKTGLTEAVQTGIGQLNGIFIAIGVMDFRFMGGSMGSVVGEKITRLIEYATNKFLPLILVCASGGARMQEGTFSLMQMAKISAALYDYQSNKKLFYVSILTSPTTGGVTASFAMLGDIIIAEPKAYIAFAGKRVIEQTLRKRIPDGSQASEHLFRKGLVDPIVPRNTLKGVLSDLFQLHAFFPLNPKKIK